MAKRKTPAAVAPPAAPVVYTADLADFQADPSNPNKGSERGRTLLEDSVREMGAGRSMVADKAGRIVAGNKTREALMKAGVTHAIVIETDGVTPVIVKRPDWDLDDKLGPARKYAFADNRVGELSLTWDDQVLMETVAAGMDLGALWTDAEMDAITKAALDENGSTNGGGKGGAKQTAAADSLVHKFVVPPFTVLDARQGYWQDRKRSWHGLGINPVAGREHLPSTVNVSAGKYEYMGGRGAHAGGSSFDPVLAELCCRWFCPKGGSVLDPFAGESTKGIVAEYLGLKYTGVELRPAQVETNKVQAEFVGVTPNWLIGDSAKLDEILPTGATYDLMFTSPPYYDLEIYSSSEKDGSAFATYETFLDWYERIIKAACDRLNPNRFAVVKVTAFRDKKTGVYHDFVSDNIRAFQAAGMVFYNDAVLITPIGTMPLRAGMHFQAGRKLEKGHQNVLVFYKGDTRKVKEHFHDVECGDIGTPDEAPAGEAGS